MADKMKVAEELLAIKAYFAGQAIEAKEEIIKEVFIEAQQTIENAISMLKEQEPEKVKDYADIVDGIKVGYCPKCDRKILWNPEKEETVAFCKYCGNAVKWND